MPEKLGKPTDSDGTMFLLLVSRVGEALGILNLFNRPEQRSDLGRSQTG